MVSGRNHEAGIRFQRQDYASLFEISTFCEHSMEFYFFAKGD